MGKNDTNSNTFCLSKLNSTADVSFIHYKIDIDIDIDIDKTQLKSDLIFDILIISNFALILIIHKKNYMKKHWFSLTNNEGLIFFQVNAWTCT